MTRADLQAQKVNLISEEIRVLKNFKCFLQTYGLTTNATDEEIWYKEEEKNIEFNELVAMKMQEGRTKYES
jgi:hypothetical protein